MNKIIKVHVNLYKQFSFSSNQQIIQFKVIMLYCETCSKSMSENTLYCDIKVMMLMMNNKF